MQDIYSSTDTFFVSWLDRENFALALLTNMLDVKTTVTLNAAHNSFWGTLVPVVGSMITTVITTFVFFFLLVAVVLRMVMLWLLIAISPLGIAAVVMKDAVNIPLLSEIDWFKEFIKHAFYPTLAAFPLSVGMIMILAGNTHFQLGATGQDVLTSMLSGDVYALVALAAIG